MKYFKVFIFIICIIILLLVLNYARINIRYFINKSSYIETLNIYGNKNNYVPQGLAYSKKYNVVMQTSYNSKHTVSMLYVIDFNTGNLLKELKLKEINDSDNVNHVGGITTDDNTVWISNDFEINEYSLDDIINTNNDYIKSNKNTKLLNRGDFCTYNNGILWIGDFYLKPFYPVKDNNPLLLGYEVNNIDYNNPKYRISLPKMVQGLTFDDNNNFIFTRSFTYLINSDLVMYRYNSKDKFNKSNKINNIKIPPMAEGLFYKDGYLYILFENSSNSYNYAYPKIKKIIKLDIKKIDD